MATNGILDLPSVVSSFSKICLIASIVGSYEFIVFFKKAILGRDVATTVENQTVSATIHKI